MDGAQKKSSMKDHRRKAMINAAFQIFVEKKIEPVSMGEIAELAGVGRATLFRYYPNKLELVIAVCAAKWKEYLDALDNKDYTPELLRIKKMILNYAKITE